MERKNTLLDYMFERGEEPDKKKGEENVLRQQRLRYGGDEITSHTRVCQSTDWD